MIGVMKLIASWLVAVRPLTVSPLIWLHVTVSVCGSGSDLVPVSVTVVLASWA